VKSEEFVREVDEELKREQLGKLWQRYGILVVGLAVLLVLGTAAKVGWDHWRQNALAAEARRYFDAQQALAAGRSDEAASQFAAIAGDGDTGYAALSRLKEAEAKLARKDMAGAVESLRQLGESKAGDTMLRQYGALLAAARELDTADPGELTRRLEPLSAGDAPWRYRARELLALVAIRTGDLGKAREILQQLSHDVGVPPTQQRRAEELLQAIGGPAGPQASS
jgi:hypothetical protein